MARKGQTLTKEMLKSMGFVDLIYDARKDEYTLFRAWFPNHHCDGKRLKQIKISPETQEHPYGEDFKTFRASFTYNNQKYSISFNRFLWVWEKGFIKDTDIVKLKEDATTHSIDDYKLQDYRDHSGWKRGNQYTCIKEKIKEEINNFIDAYERGESYKLKF